MNYLISAYSINPYHGSEDGVGWNWVLQYEKHYKPGDRIVVLTKRFNEEATRRGFVEYGIVHAELEIVDVPMWLNWFRERHSVFHHMYYILWQHWAWLWVKNSSIKFDVIHHVTMGDYRIPGKMYKMKSARTIFGPVGGAQITPRNLKCYEKNKIAGFCRELVNKSCDINPFYADKIKHFTEVIPSNMETYQQILKIRGSEGTRKMVELGVSAEFCNLQVRREPGKKIRILYAGRIIEKKGIWFLMDVAQQLKQCMDFSLEICGEGELSGQIEEMIRTRNLQNQVALVGAVSREKIVEKYLNSDIFVFPSLRETGGTVLVEAMACGLPIVAFRTSFCAELAQKECGIFVDTEQSLPMIQSDFCRAIISLAENRDQAEQLGINGYQYVNTELTWEKKYDYIYEQ